MPTRLQAVIGAALGVVAALFMARCGPASPPFYRCQGELRPKASFVETCIAARQILAEPMQLKMQCLSYAAQHGYCEVVP